MVAVNKNPYQLLLRIWKCQASQQRLNAAATFFLLVIFYLVVNAAAVFVSGSDCLSGAQFEVEAKRHKTLRSPPPTPTLPFLQPSQLKDEETDAPSFMGLSTIQSMNPTSLRNFPIYGIGGPSDMTNICLQHKCSVAHNVISSKSCTVAFKCGGCATTGAQSQMTTHSYMCEASLPSVPNALILGIAYSSSSELLKGSQEPTKRESALLELHWDAPMEPVDISRCMIENLSLRKQQQVLQQKAPQASLSPAVLQEVLGIPPHQVMPMLPPRWSSTTSLLHVRMVFGFTITNLGDSLATSFTITIRFTPPDKYYFHQKYVAGGQCTQTVSTITMKKSTKSLLAPTQLLTILHSVSVPFEDTHSIGRDNFQVEIKCDQKSACNLSKYRICARILCNTRPEWQIVALNKLEIFLNHLEKHPEIAEDIPAIPEHLLPEYELLKAEMALKTQKEMIEQRKANADAQMEPRKAYNEILLAAKQAEESERRRYAAQDEAAVKPESELNFSPETVSAEPLTNNPTVEYRAPITVMANRAARFPQFIRAPG